MSSPNPKKEIPYEIPEDGYTWNPNKSRYEVYIGGELQGIAATVPAAAAIYEEARK